MGFLPDRVAEQVHDLVRLSSLVLLELRQRGERQTTVIEVIVDNVERGATLDEITELSRKINSLLDSATEHVAGRYRLEVSTPGLGRPMEHEWQYRKNIGRLLKLIYKGEGTGMDAALFRLLGVESGRLLLLGVAGRAKGRKKDARNADEEPTRVPIGDIIKAIVEPEF